MGSNSRKGPTIGYWLYSGCEFHVFVTEIGQLHLAAENQVVKHH